MSDDEKLVLIGDGKVFVSQWTADKIAANGGLGGKPLPAGFEIVVISVDELRERAKTAKEPAKPKSSGIPWTAESVTRIAPTKHTGAGEAARRRRQMEKRAARAAEVGNG